MGPQSISKSKNFQNQEKTSQRNTKIKQIPKSKNIFASDVFSEASHHQWSDGWSRERRAQRTEKWSGREEGRFQTQEIKKIKSQKKFKNIKKSKVKKNPKSKIKAMTTKNHQKTQKFENILHELCKKPLKRKRGPPGVRSFNISPSRLQIKSGELFLSWRVEDPPKDTLFCVEMGGMDV